MKAIPSTRLRKGLAAFLSLLACALLSVPAFAGDSQLDNGENNIRLKGQWQILVPGQSVVCEGRGEMPWEFRFVGPYAGEYSESFLLTNAFPVEEGMDCFERDWPGTALYLQERAYDYYGDLLRFISFDQATSPEGDGVYVMQMRLESGKRRMDVTVCYRFRQSYYAAYIGVDNGDMPELFLLTRRAAGLFRDETEAPLCADPEYYTGPEISPDNRPWELPVLNVFSILRDYTRWEFAQGPE